MKKSSKEQLFHKDFKSFWGELEFFGGEGCMSAAELAWDYQEEKVLAILEHCHELTQELLSIVEASDGDK